MRAILLTLSEHGKRFDLCDLPIPEPRPDEIRIWVRAAAFNPSDYQRRDELGTEQLPTILGGEVAGMVDAVGPSVTQFTPGDAVYAYLAQSRSGFAEYVCVHAAFVAHKPRNLTFEQAAAVPVAGLTAYECVMRASALAAGKAVFIAGGSGGVGTMAIQLARLRGATSIAVTAGGDASARYLTEELEVSPNQIVRYHGRSREELVEAALKANGGQYYPVVIDCVGGAMTSLCCRVVDFDGHVVSIVAGPSDAAHAGAQSDEEQLFDRSATFHFELLYARARYGSPQTWPVYGRSLAELTRLFEAEQLRAPAVTDVGTLSVVSVEEALARLQEGHVQGKLVMVVGPTEPGDLS